MNNAVKKSTILTFQAGQIYVNPIQNLIKSYKIIFKFKNKNKPFNLKNICKIKKNIMINLILK